MLTRKEFAELVRGAKAEHPVWFDPGPDTKPDAAQLEQVEQALAVRLPPDYTWFLKEYGGGDFAFAAIYSADPTSHLYIVSQQDYLGGAPAVAFSDDGTGNMFAFPVAHGVARDESVIHDHETNQLRSSPYDGSPDFVHKVAISGPQ